jgi:hypothetical protein
MDDIDECASLIGIPVTSRESLVMSTSERANERTNYIRRAKEQQQQQHENQPNQFVIKHEASKQRGLDKIVIWYTIVQQSILSISLLFWVNFVL